MSAPPARAIGHADEASERLLSAVESAGPEPPRTVTRVSEYASDRCHP
jgi:hypothetical protein